jgi:hypothetical protein
VGFANVRVLAGDFVLNNEVKRQYTLVFDRKRFNGYSDSSIIPVKNRREVELFLLCLGEEASVFMDDHARMFYPEVWDWLSGRTYPEVLGDLKWTCREQDEIVDLIERVPLPGFFGDNPAPIHRKDFPTERIGQEYVHKAHKENVLITQSYRCGNMFYFNGFKDSPEFKIDHSSDHLEGIIAFEVVRQAGMASVHLTGVPFTGQIVLSKFVFHYKGFIDYDEPYLVHIIPVIRQRREYFYIVFNIIQTGKSCATGYMAGLVYNKESYRKHRNFKYIDKVLYQDK